MWEYPRETIPVWQRPWVEKLILDGYPVEYRAFVRDGHVAGVSNYYPQRPLRRMQRHLGKVVNMTLELIRNVEPPFLWHETPLRLTSGLDPDGVHFTADFLVDKYDRVLFLEGGPPHELGAHPCCFRPGRNRRVRHEGPELRRPEN